MAMSYHLLLHLCCYVLFLAICSCLRAAAALSFDYNFSVPGDLASANLLFMGDTSAARDRINLTNPTNWSTGRVAHRQLVRLWDDRTGKAANFTTSFSFAIDRNSTDQADGMAFFVGPPQESLPPDMNGGFLGLVPNSTESPRTVGVEFDTCRNLWDPQGNVIDHIGVDVNNITSTKTKALKDLSLAGTMWAEIMYDAKSTTMAVTLRLADGTNHSLETVVDLKAAGLPQDAAVGFSAATGNLYESHQLLSWSFHSTVDPSIPPSVAASRKKRITASGGFLHWSHGHVACKNGAIRLHGSLLATARSESCEGKGLERSCRPRAAASSPSRSFLSISLLPSPRCFPLRFLSPPSPSSASAVGPSLFLPYPPRSSSPAASTPSLFLPPAPSVFSSPMSSAALLQRRFSL